MLGAGLLPARLVGAIPDRRSTRFHSRLTPRVAYRVREWLPSLGCTRTGIGRAPTPR